MTLESSSNQAAEAIDQPSSQAISTTHQLQKFCVELAHEWRANVMLVERCNNDFEVLASAPDCWVLQPLDVIALQFMYSTGQASGLGSDRAAASDWLFVPVTTSARQIALGIAGRYCRRRFDVEDLQHSRRQLTQVIMRMDADPPPSQRLQGALADASTD